MTLDSVAHDALASFRTAGSETIRDALVGAEALPPELMASPEDHGLFGPDSITWRVHGDSAMLVGGLRALILQSLHPLGVAAMEDHSIYTEDPVGRFRRTTEFVAATTFGNTSTAERAIQMVRRVHTSVTGTAPERAPFNGRTYAASDPHLVTWVHITEVDSFLRAFNKYGTGSLSPSEQDRYVAEMAQVGEAVGGADVPTDVRSLNKAMQRYRRELAGTPEGRRGTRFLLAPPIALAARGPYAVIAAAAVGMLPLWTRLPLRLPFMPVSDALVVRPATTALTRGFTWFLSDPASGRQNDFDLA